jgi:hypothetical protein
MLIALAARADRAIRPADCFKPLPGSGFIVEMGLGKFVFGHGLAPMAKPYPKWVVVSTTYFTL